ncbi:hypothetical protein E2C01_054037 [Portunus trituberculatus]|uniref:Tc1-like transposase DDE domain-containing protein n=1 Tax=Portunus trituberculatus TaxID=210409 RepID=A0A5B7GM22_PORTR|nr:hypothetical protein [Portunus trituberculatus]
MLFPAFRTNMYCTSFLMYHSLIDMGGKCTDEKTIQAIIHVHKAGTGWLNNCEINIIKDWPGNSPDISPIENLWVVMKAKLRGHDTSTLSKLEKELHNC